MRLLRFARNDTFPPCGGRLGWGAINAVACLPVRAQAGVCGSAQAGKSFPQSRALIQVRKV